MTPEQFIKQNPNPPNIEQVNNDLVKLIQDPAQAKFYKKNVYKLFKANARLIYVVYRQYNYNQSLSSIMSFVYEGIEATAKEYKLGSKKPYYSYAISYIRGLLQKYYNYNESLVHVPVMKKKKISHEYAEINNYNEHEYLVHDDDSSVADDLDNLFKEYESQPLTAKQKQELEIVKMSRNMNIKEISEKTKLGIGKIRNIIKKTTPKLKNFYNKNLI